MYADVWSRLQNVKMIGDRLWERVSKNEVRNFIHAFAAVKMAVNRGSLIQREEHYKQLKVIFSTFENFRISGFLNAQGGQK